MKNFKYSLISIILSIVIVISGCSLNFDKNKNDNNHNDNKLNEQTTDTNNQDSKLTQDFNKYCNDMFLEIATQDALTTNYFISDISNFDISEYPTTMVSFDSNDYEVDTDKLINYLEKLEEFDYSKLSYSQQITYDTIKYYIMHSLDGADMELLYEPLGRAIGFQAELPITLAEYSFYTEEDINRYLTALPSIYNTFEEIMKFEKIKSEEGLFMSDKTADGIIEQCSNFIKNKEDNFLITCFNEKIDNYEGLSISNKKSYKEQNKDIVLNKIIPAYELMIDELKKLKGTGHNEGGLCNFTNGKQYYNYLICNNVGDEISAKKLKETLQKRIDKDVELLSDCYLKDSELFDKMSEITIDETTPKEILQTLYEIAQRDFPKIPAIHYTLKTVDKSLEDFLSPAMYYKPPVDNDRINSIYINNSKIDDNIETFTTLAHEGYPGHMYQFNYEKTNDNAPLRQAMGFTGISEGWAEYIEYKSYEYINELDPNIAKALALNTEISLCVEAMADIGVNYEGWSVSELKDYVCSYFKIDDTVANNIYQSCIETPTNTLCYAYGAIVYEELRETALEEKGAEFNEQEFNKFILDVGFSTFPILRDRFEKYYLNE